MLTIGRTFAYNAVCLTLQLHTHTVCLTLQLHTHGMLNLTATHGMLNLTATHTHQIGYIQFLFVGIKYILTDGPTFFFLWSRRFLSWRSISTRSVGLPCRKTQAQFPFWRQILTRWTGGIFPITQTNAFGYDYESMKATRASLAEAWVI